MDKETAAKLARALHGIKLPAYIEEKDDRWIVIIDDKIEFKPVFDDLKNISILASCMDDLP
jgi:hypothetical protein